jgi:hypothetical protein
MFLYQLTEIQKSAFFEVANRVVFADQRLVDSEVNYLGQLTAEAGLKRRPLPSDEPLSVLLSVFDTRQSRMAVIVEVIVLALVDGDYHDLEDVFANEVIQGFGLDAAEHDQVNRIAEHVAAAAVTMWELEKEDPEEPD